jgi:hypothetical protein
MLNDLDALSAALAGVAGLRNVAANNPYTSAWVKGVSYG